MKKQLLKAKKHYQEGRKFYAAKILRELFEVSAQESVKFLEELFFNTTH